MGENHTIITRYTDISSSFLGEHNITWNVS